MLCTHWSLQCNPPPAVDAMRGITWVSSGCPCLPSHSDRTLLTRCIRLSCQGPCCCQPQPHHSTSPRTITTCSSLNAGQLAGRLPSAPNCPFFSGSCSILRWPLHLPSVRELLPPLSCTDQPESDTRWAPELTYSSHNRSPRWRHRLSQGRLCGTKLPRVSIPVHRRQTYPPRRREGRR